MIDNDKTLTIIDSQGFKFTVYIYNGQDKPTPLNKSIIKSIVLDETSDEWFITGFIIIEDKFNVLQRPWTSEITLPDGMIYKFRNDGNDQIILRIQPILDGQPKDALNPEVWNIDLVLAVYDVQDFSFGDESATKYHLSTYLASIHKHLINHVGLMQFGGIDDTEFQKNIDRLDDLVRPESPHKLKTIDANSVEKFKNVSSQLKNYYDYHKKD